MRDLLARYASSMDRVSVFVGHSCSVLFFACIIASALEVVMRYGFDRPTSWSTELSMTLCATAWVLAVGYVTERNRHISITMLEIVVGPRIWRFFRLLQLLAAFLAVSFLARAVWGPAMKVLSRPEFSGTAMNSLQPSYLKVLLLVGCVLYLLQLLANIIRWFQRTEKENFGGH
ncbi:MAG TPA: TRAP transporter small permease [Tianweitania sediminis]|jgi:TRAP-type C4-dicarboxylate transport system permease small subunit|nr:TRAP transporter small permease [Tianweitania sediminis]